MTSDTFENWSAGLDFSRPAYSAIARAQRRDIAILQDASAVGAALTYGPRHRTYAGYGMTAEEYRETFK